MDKPTFIGIIVDNHTIEAIAYFIFIFGILFVVTIVILGINKFLDWRKINKENLEKRQTQERRSRIKELKKELGEDTEE